MDYKICILGKQNEVKQIIVFPSPLSKDNENNENSTPLFSEKEMQFIETNKIEVKQSKQSIHKDDTISCVKTKILKELDYSVSYYELYLFSNVYDKQKNIENLFTAISGKKEYISEYQLKQLLVNWEIPENVLQNMKKTSKYFLDDLLFLNYESDQPFSYKIPLGKKFHSFYDELFCVNPFHIYETTQITHSPTNPLESFENQLLFNNNGGNFVDNTIFLCFAEDVLDYCSDHQLNNEIVQSLYFPFLTNKNVIDKESLLTNRNIFIGESKKMENSEDNQNIDLLYDIYYKHIDEKINYVSKGIEVFSFILEPETHTVLPLDVIFKNIHSTKSIPFIKYNPGIRRENIYRLYSENITKYGTKIPFLKSNNIMKLAKEIGVKKKQISLSIENSLGDFYMDIHTNGAIYISGNNFKELLDPKQFDETLKSIVNPVILYMNEFLKNSGYEINLFDSIYQKNSVIEYLNFSFSVKIKKEFSLLNYPCLQPVFEIREVSSSENIYKGIEFMYKRIENYKKMDEQTVFIFDLYKNPNYNDKKKVEEIMSKYNLNFDEASKRLIEFVKDQEQFGKNIIINSPGFPVYMKMLSSFEDLLKIDIEMENRENHIVMDYLDAFQIYIHSLFVMTQAPEQLSSSELSLVKKKKHTKKKDKEPLVLDNITFGLVPNVPLVSMVSSDQEEADDIMYYQEDYDNELSNISTDENEGEDEVSLEEDNLQEYEESDDFIQLTPIPESKSTIEELTPIPESKSKSSENSLMYYAEEEEEGEEEEGEKEGGSNGIDGMKLDNLFLNRLKQKEPTLFATEVNDKFDSYSTLCQANRQRQPVILNQEEKDEIDENDKANNSKSYNHALEYSVDDKKHYYICPRYWCLKTNTAISEKEVKEGKCGGIIPKGKKTVPHGSYVYEFNHPIQHKSKDGSYQENTPGFFDKKCLPCCFKKSWEQQEERRKQCMKDDEQMDASATAAFSQKKSTKTNKKNDYIIEINRYPIPIQRMGFLPLSVQFLLQTDNQLSVNPENRKFLHPQKNTTTLLRYGVEQTAKKSFVGCIADIYAYKYKLKTVPSIQEMCNLLSESLTIDLFLKYHNGSLISAFKPKIMDLENIDYRKYENSKIVQQMNTENENEMIFMNQLILSYENFNQFLKDENSFMDYTYLWDSICLPNPKLFKTGLNLAILEISNKDTTDNIDLLCPSSVYSSVLYDVRKETVLLLKQDDFYEPIYLFTNQVITSTIISNKPPGLSVQKTFLEGGVLKNVENVLQIIRNSIQNYCPPKSSMPTKYKFKRNISAEQLYSFLLQYKVDCSHQVVNYQGKVIGIFVNYKKKEGGEKGIVLPCYPSPALENLPSKYMDDNSLWQLDYKTTVALLKKIKSTTENNVLCQPLFKIVEDNLVVGVLTETNQFIMIGNPVELADVEDGIPVLKDENYVLADVAISQKKKGTSAMEKTIKLITLETQFYASFRSTVRHILNQSSNKNMKKQLIELIENKKYYYKDKLKKIEAIIHFMCDKYVAFKKYDETTLLMMDTITDCMTNPTEKSHCVVTNENSQIMLPEKHLISGLDNKSIYFSRVADELLRYKRIQVFMLDPKIYLNITNSEYKINENEMIMLDSLLTTEFLNSLVPFKYSKAVSLNYENAYPIQSQTYPYEITLEQQKQMMEKDSTVEELEDRMNYECVELTYPVTGNANSQWKKFFPKDTLESQLAQTIQCTYYPIIYVYKKVYGQILSVAQIKEKLINAYNELFENDVNDTKQNKLYDLLKIQGKVEMINHVKNDKYSLQSAIASEVYYLTNIDLWVLSEKLELPIILFNQKPLKYLNLQREMNWLKLGNTKVPNEYYFVRSPPVSEQKQNIIPHYTFIKTPLKYNSREIMELFSGEPRFYSVVDSLQ